MEAVGRLAEGVGQGECLLDSRPALSQQGVSAKAKESPLERAQADAFDSSLLVARTKTGSGNRNGRPPVSTSEV